MIQEGDDDDGVDLVIHFVVDHDIGAGLAVTLAEVPTELDIRGKRVFFKKFLDHLDVAAVPAGKAGTAHANRNLGGRSFRHDTLLSRGVVTGRQRVGG